MPRPQDRPPDYDKQHMQHLERRQIIQHDPGPTTIEINTITIETTNDEEMTNNEEFDEIMTKQELEKYVAQVSTMYKRKDKKILPMNVPLPNGVNPGGGVNSGIDSGESSENNIGGAVGKVVSRGSRLTPERLANMKIGTNFLSEAEKQLFIDILFDYEGAIAFDDSEMGLLHPEIEPPIIIHTVPHSPWQQQNLRLPKSMQEAATAIVKEKLENGTLEFSQGPYRNRYFLVEKKNDT